jgi:hypothetical protein
VSPFVSHDETSYADLVSHGREMITLYIGKGEDFEQFEVHKSLLIKHSDYFKAMFTRQDWKEAQEG